MCGLPNSWNLKHILLDCIHFKNKNVQLFGIENKDWDEWLDVINSNDQRVLRKFVILIHKIAYKMQTNL